MEVVYLRSFLNDIKKVNEKQIKKRLKKLIEEIKQADKLEDVPNASKLKGYPTAYRIRIGNYRVGIYKESVVVLARLVKRNDIYKVFPKKEKG